MVIEKWTTAQRVIVVYGVECGIYADGPVNLLKSNKLRRRRVPPQALGSCPLYPESGQKSRHLDLSALCQERTNALQQKYVATRRPVNWLCLVQIDDLDPIAIGS